MLPRSGNMSLSRSVSLAQDTNRRVSTRAAYAPGRLGNQGDINNPFLGALVMWRVVCRSQSARGEVQGSFSKGRASC